MGQSKERIVVEMLHTIPNTLVPDIPIANGIDIEALVKPDTDAGREPFYVTFVLGEADQVSHNNRRYVGNVAIEAIYKAINQLKIGGNQGHTPEAERGTYFAVPVLHWVGAMIKDGVAWGKAYIPGDSERMREMRGYYMRQKATGGRVGTSLEGLGLQVYNADDEIWDILELDVLRIDAVEALGVGVDIAGSQVPHITTELKESVQHGELEIGSLVSWEDNGALMRGSVNTIWTEGEVEVPHSDSPPLVASEDDPLARMDVYYPNYDDGGWSLSGHQVVRFFSQITKIEFLPEHKAQEDNDTSLILGEGTMPETKDTVKPEDRIAELTQQHETEVGDLTTQLQEASRELRPLRSTIATLCEAVGVEADADIVEAVRNLIGERNSLVGENSVLLESAIEAQISTEAKIIGEALQSNVPSTVTFGKTVQTMIASSIAAEKISKQADIAPTVERVLNSESSKAMLEALKIAVMGPNVESEFDYNDDDNSEDEAITY